MSPHTLAQKSEAQVRDDLRGFPEEAVGSVLGLRDDFTAERLDDVMRHVLGFYLPKARAQALEGLPKETRLREDLGVDSLAMAEAAFKFDELFGVAIETRETAGVETLGDLHAFLVRKLEL